MTELSTENKGNLETSSNSNDKSKDQLLDDVLKTRSQIEYLIEHISKTQKTCHKLKSENSYLQDYVGSLMSSGLVDKK